jgi:hypothetical protein
MTGELLLQAFVGLASAFVGGSAVYAGIKHDLGELRARVDILHELVMGRERSSRFNDRG